MRCWQVVRREDEPVKINSVAWGAHPLDNVSKEVAKAIMKRADKMSHNSELSVTEIDTFLKGTPYEAFASWMLVNSQRNFKKFDRDKNGAIVLEELQLSVRAFMEEQQAMDKEYEEAESGANPSAASVANPSAESEANTLVEAPPPLVSSAVVQEEWRSAAVEPPKPLDTFDMIDSNGDGFIDRSEWNAHMQRPATPDAAERTRHQHEHNYHEADVSSQMMASQGGRNDSTIDRKLEQVCS